ncbi:MAG: hypothetical protein AcusKO_02710 [Acuticoccus sp.]
MQRKARIGSDKTQRRLREMVEVLNTGGASLWFRAPSPMPGIGPNRCRDSTAEPPCSSCARGRANDVLDAIDAVDAGVHA